MSIKVGDRIPLFTLKNQRGEEVSIQTFFGKPFVIFFYPKDNTAGCTAQACGFRDRYEDLQNIGAEVIGISADDVESHREFANKYNLPFTLLSDSGNKIRKLFGVPRDMFGLLPGRVTYVVDDKGFVSFIYNSQLKVEKHVIKALAQLREIQGEGKAAFRS